MTKFSIMALIAAGLLAACGTIGKKPVPASLFATPISSTVLAVTIPTRGAVATLVLVARNQGIETWQTGDAVSISVRDGLLLGTRGLGFDVMGSDVSQTRAALSGARTGQYAVKRSYLTADNQPEVISATCTMSRAAADGHFVEDCTTAVGNYRNEYWLDGSGRAARSVQWIGPQIQYVTLGYVSPS